MRLWDRDLFSIAKAPFSKRHYRTLANMARVYPAFPSVFMRYFFNSGTYPHRVAVRTPMGTVLPRLYSYHDLLTVNEVFCREDYRADCNLRVVVDIGSNIGISALYFLTRTPFSYCYLFEPVAENVRKMQENLQRFSGRFTVQQVAVADKSQLAKFGTEPTGRYGGLHARTGSYIQVQCLHVNDILGDVLRKEGRIDVVKIDTEGTEAQTVRAIDHAYMSKIGVVYFETSSGSVMSLTGPEGCSWTG